MMEALPRVGDVIRFKGDGRDYQVMRREQTFIEAWQGFNQKQQGGQRVWVVRDSVERKGDLADMPPFRFIKTQGVWIRRAAS